MFLTLEVFHLEISGNDDNKEQFWNIKLISVTLEVSHLEMSGRDINEEPETLILNTELILVILDVFHLSKSGKFINEGQSKNMQLILKIFFIPSNLISNASSLKLLSISKYFVNSYSFPLCIILQ